MSRGAKWVIASHMRVFEIQSGTRETILDL